MEMSIDRAHEILSNGLVNAPSEHEWCVAFKIAISTMRKYQLLQADYETRLKADMVAMLTELQTEIEKKKFVESSCSFMDKTEEVNYAVYLDEISDLIQQKINSLKVNTDGKIG